VNVPYETGDYLKAQKANTKLKKKVSKKLGVENAYIVKFHLMAARNDLALGLLNDFDNNIQQAVAMSERVHKALSAEHILVLNEVATMLLRNGNPNQAEAYIKLAQGDVGKIENNEDIKAFTDLNSSAIYATQGFYAKAIEFISENEKYYSGRAVSKMTVIDPKSGKLKSVKLNEQEVAKRLDDYARLMNLKSNTYRKMGDYVNADKTFLLASDWIDNNLGKGNIRFVENQLWLGMHLII
jgi:hypothetical protein